MNFERSVAFLMSPHIEGGYAKVRQDRGGETKYGISKRRFPHIDIKNLTEREAEALYREYYWDAMELDSMPGPLRYMLFDTGVLFGIDDSIKWFQEAIGTLPDGIVGPKTLAKAEDCNILETYRLLFVKRARRHAMQDEVQLETFGNGWYARLFDITQLFLDEYSRV